MKRFSKILCVVDPERTMDTAIVQTLRIAEDHQAEVTFISVPKAVEPWITASQNKDTYSKELDKCEESQRKSIASRILALAPYMKANIVVISGIAFIEIIKHVIHHQHDLVVKCAEDLDWIDRMLGSEDMHLLRKCPCPVLMLKPEQKGSFRKVMATIDVNDDINALDDGRVQEQLNHQVLEYSAALCIPELSEMHIGSVWEAYAEDFYRYGAFSQLPEEKVDQYVEKTYKDCSSKLDVLVKKMDEMLGQAAMQYIQPRSHLVKGKASQEIPLMAESHEIDLIVMGTVGRVGIPGLIIGNTAESILEQTKCSVLAIKPVGFKTPIE